MSVGKPRLETTAVTVSCVRAQDGSAAALERREDKLKGCKDLRPEAGRDCLIWAIFTRQRSAKPPRSQKASAFSAGGGGLKEKANLHYNIASQYFLLKSIFTSIVNFSKLGPHWGFWILKWTIYVGGWVEQKSWRVVY